MSGSRRPVPLVALWLMAALASGCASVNVSGSLLPGTVLTGREIYYVEKFENDERGLQDVIRDVMIEMGLKATSGTADSLPPDTEIVVTYKDRWMWDITIYRLSSRMVSTASMSCSVVAGSLRSPGT